MTIDPRGAYLTVGTSTASPEKLLTMLWDRLLLNLEVAQSAIGEHDLSVVNDRLVHAQDIVFELRTTLKTDVWAGAAGLASLYLYVAERLTKAHVDQDRTIIEASQQPLEPPRDASPAAAKEHAGQ